MSTMLDIEVCIGNWREGLRRGDLTALWDLGSFLEEVMPLELSLERTETYWSPGGTVGQDMPCSASLE